MSLVMREANICTYDRLATDSEVQVVCQLSNFGLPNKFDNCPNQPEEKPTTPIEVDTMKLIVAIQL